MVSSTPRPHFTPRKDPVPILQEAEWAQGPEIVIILYNYIRVHRMLDEKLRDSYLSPNKIRVNK